MYLRYLGGVFFIFISISTVLPFFSWFERIYLSNQPENQLMSYQLRKIDNLLGYDTVFIGDSSLGNAIDAKLLSELSGKSCVNLALTGSHGYGASYNFIRRVYRSGKIKKIVMVHTIDMMMREQKYEGYFYSAEFKDLFLLRDFSLKEIIDYVNEIAGIMFNTQAIMNVMYSTLHPGSKTDWLINDYIRQGAKKVVDLNNVNGHSTKSINEKNLMFLERISKFCKENGIQLIYLHGPSLDILSWKSKEYLDAINIMISKVGIKVLPDVVTFPYEMMGDNFNDHVAPENKNYATRCYWKLLEKFLSD